MDHASMAVRDEMLEDETAGLLEEVESVRRPRLRQSYFKINSFTILFAVSVLLNTVFIGFTVRSWLCDKSIGNKSRPKQSFEKVPLKAGSYEKGFSSDLDSIKSEINLKEYQYNGGVELDQNGNFVQENSSYIYIADPSPEVDRAWDSLMIGLNVDLDDSEADANMNTMRWPETGKHFTGLEMSHSLHCLNRLRQAFYPQYYNKIFKDPNSPSRTEHIGHCINHLRQAIQCHADLTPMEWMMVGNKAILKTSTWHTCRNFEKIHTWAQRRQTKFSEMESVRNGSLILVD